MPELFPVSLDEMIEEVRRELRLRATFYAERVREGRMSRRTADRQYDRMDAVLKLLERERDGRGSVDQR